MAFVVFWEVVAADVAHAQQAQQPELSLAWVPEEAPGLFAVLGVFPGRLKVFSWMADLEKELVREVQRSGFPVRPQDVRQVTFVAFLDPERLRGRPGDAGGGYILHLKKPLDVQRWQAWLKEGTRKQWKQRSYHSLAPTIAAARVNEGRTVIVAGGPQAEEIIRYMLDAGPQGAQDAAWAKRMRTLRLGKGEDAPLFSQITFAVYFHSEAIKKVLPTHEEVLRQDGPLAANVLLLLRKPQAVFFGLNLAPDKVDLGYVLACGEEQTAERLAKILQGLIATGRLLLGSLEGSAPKENEKQVLSMARSLLNKVQVAQEKNNVVALLALNKQETQMVAAAFLSALQAARQAGRRAQSQNNLRQLVLAMHNFYDRHKYLPPAAARQWNGKQLEHPVSWRVLILPYLDRMELFQQYRFDEPWDSPHNLKLLKKMPEAFRHPNDDPNSTHTSYFVLVGPGTVFDPKVERMRFANITDGTSNTLMIVETKRKVPWTKPEDILFDPAKPPPKLGGWLREGFNAAFCDGSVRLLPYDIPARTLRLLIQRNDGQPVRLP